jgi:hypothetical protein
VRLNAKQQQERTIVPACLQPIQWSSSILLPAYCRSVEVHQDEGATGQVQWRILIFNWTGTSAAVLVLVYNAITTVLYNAAVS